MSVFKRFSRTDKIILQGSIVILIVLSYLLYDDSLITPKNTSQEAMIGTLTSTDRDVRRKTSDNFIWLPGNKKDEIHNNDSIFTGSGSQAQIRLNDGSVLQIQENSLVNLNLKNGQMELDLRFGQFRGDGRTPLRVKTGAEEYTIQGQDAKFEINRAKNGEMDVKILSGKVEITGKSGKQKLSSNESLVISKKGIEKKPSEAQILLLTKPDSILYPQTKKTPVFFEWEGRGPIALYNLEISQTESFKKILETRLTREQKIDLKEPLKEGPYFWRVKGLDLQHKVLASSKVQKFYLSELPAPEISTPQNEDRLKITALNTPTGPKAPLEITWSGHSRHVSYEWQLGTEEDFKTLLSEKSLTATKIQTPPLSSGRYFTRVRGVDKDHRPSPWSAVHGFHFEVISEPLPPAPRLVKKHLQFTIPPLEGRAPSAETSPQMAWTKVPEAKNYRWELSSNSRFKGAQSQDLTETKIAWTQFKPGKYYFRVFSRSDLGQVSAPSETGVLEVYGDAPILKPIPHTLVKITDIHATAPPKDVVVKWSGVAGAAAYHVEAAQTPDFTTPEQWVVNETQGTIPLPQPGKYYVRVKALNEASQDISGFSETREAVYQFIKTLKAPELREPNDQNTIFLQKDMSPLVWLEWSSVADAEKYLLEVSNKADFSQTVFSKTLTETRYLIREKIPYGPIYWRVRALAMDEDLNSDWAQRQFMIYHHKNQGF